MKNWPFIEKLKTAFPQAEIFLVGGAVRDMLLKRPRHDYDFVVRGVEIEQLQKLLSDLGEVNLVGHRFGVLKFRPQGDKEYLDIALPRKEFSLAFSGGYRDFEIQTDHLLPIEEDLSRRDFTVNALAYDLLNKKIIDPFGGQKDLEKKIIRTVGSPVSRFQEDYSRMLRAVRFACQLDFDISEKTSAAISKLAYHLNDKVESEVNNPWVVAREVISSEFLKGFNAAPDRCLELYDQLNLLEQTFPELKALQECEQSAPYHLEGNVWQHTVLALQVTSSKEFKSYFPEPLPLMTKLSILFHDLGKPQSSSQDAKGIHFFGHAKIGAAMTKKICQRLKLGATPYYPFACDKLAWLVQHHLFSIEAAGKKAPLTKLEELFFSTRWPSESLLPTILADQLASKTSKAIDSIAPFKELQARLLELAPQGKLAEPLINGDEIMAWCRLKPGVQIKAILKEIRELQLAGEVTDKTAAKKFIIAKHG